MGFGEYRSVLGLAPVRHVLLLGLAMRIPLWASEVVLTLHVVAHLHESYSAAGLLSGAATITLAISNPWRGRRLDRVGLRRALTPSLVVLTACWSVAPFLGYWPLLVLATVAGLFQIPSFTIVRQVLIHNVPDDQRRTALSIDSVTVEISFMIGPVLGVLLATYGSTAWALFGCQLATVASGIVLWVVNPALRGPLGSGAEQGARPDVRSWLRLDVAALLLAAAATTVVLAGTDVGIVAALRHFGHQDWIGWVLAVWGAGSAVGGIVYGLLRRGVPVFPLLGLLAAATAPVALAPGPLTLTLLLLVAGVFCAPNITATVDALSRRVPERVRGEALGWHGAALTAGSAAGAPVAGVAIDRAGWPGGFVAVAIVGAAVAIFGLAVTALRTRNRAAGVASAAGVATVASAAGGDLEELPEGVVESRR